MIRGITILALLVCMVVIQTKDYSADLLKLKDLINTGSKGRAYDKLG